MKYLKFILLFLLGNEVLAQKISNVRAVSEGNQVKIAYDFEAPDASQKYRVELFSSLDNFVTPLNSVSGTVGDTIIAGKGKIIYWSSNRAGLNFEGMVSFEVRAQKYVPLLFTNTFEPIYKMGKKMPVTYTGYNAASNSYFILYNTENSIKLNTVPNPGTSIIVLPKINTGKYQLKLVNPSTNQEAISTEFVLKKNKHLLIKIGIPIAVLAGATGAYFYFQGKTDKSSNGVIEDLPVPIDPN